MGINNFLTTKPGLPLSIGFAAVFFLFGMVGILRHEMWLDEMHHWLIARESHSLKDLFFNIRQEGHPPLWNIILYGITRWTSNPIYMQMVHISFAALAMVIFFYYAPFSMVFKTGILFSYFFFYEYSIISRNYVPGILLIWIICVLLTGRSKSFIPVCLISGLLANVHLFYLFISFAVLIVLLFTSYKEKGKWEIMAGIFLYVLLFAIAVRFIIPPDNHFLIRYNADGFVSFNRLEKGSGIFLKAFFSLPDFTKINCWNSFLLTERFHMISLLPAIISFFIPFIIFARNKVCLFFFYFSGFCISGFLYLSPLSVGVRYFGLIYVTFIMTLWFQKIFKDEYEIQYSKGLGYFLDKLNLYLKRPFIALLFSVQILSSGILFVKDFYQPFSQAKNAAQYIVETGLFNTKLAATNVSAISSIKGYLQCNLYSPEANNYLKYSDWTLNPFQFSEPGLIESMKDLLRKNNQEWVLISNHQLIFNNDKLNPRLNYLDKEINVSLIKSFIGSLVNSENYFIYKIQKR